MEERKKDYTCKWCRKKLGSKESKSRHQKLVPSQNYQIQVIFVRNVGMLPFAKILLNVLLKNARARRRNVYAAYAITNLKERNICKSIYELTRKLSINVVHVEEHLKGKTFITNIYRRLAQTRKMMLLLLQVTKIHSSLMKLFMGRQGKPTTWVGMNLILHPNYLILKLKL